MHVHTQLRYLNTQLRVITIHKIMYHFDPSRFYKLSLFEHSKMF